MLSVAVKRLDKSPLVNQELQGTPVAINGIPIALSTGHAGICAKVGESFYYVSSADVVIAAVRMQKSEVLTQDSNGEQ